MRENLILGSFKIHKIVRFIDVPLQDIKSSTVPYMSALQSIEEVVFKKIHTGNLVYNTCWEDPRCDRGILNFDEHSEIVMLTSAGCNALDYLLDNPKSIDAIDVNPRQNALLDLKKGLFQVGTHQDLYNYFGTGAFDQAKEFYRANLKSTLQADYSREFWDNNIGDYFSGRGVRKSFYWRGSSGTVAWMVRQWLKTQPETERLIQKLFDSQNMTDQQAVYDALEPRFLNRFLSWFLSRHVVQSMLGVPKSQQQMAREKYTDGMAGYVRQCMRQVFTGIPIQDNYFWQLYFFGTYLPNSCPNYLKAENFDTLKSRVDRIATHSMTLSHFLEHNPGKYSHFILLDHQDWLAANNYPALEHEWKLIFENARPGTKILLRSAAPDANFLPKWVPEKLEFDLEAAQWSHNNDRVGTYASTHIARVR